MHESYKYLKKHLRIELSTATNHTCNNTKSLNARPLKLTTIGDQDIGITSFLMTFTTGEYPTGYVPVVFENNVIKILVDGKEFTLGVYETSGQQEYDRLRPISYSLTDCFLLFYAIDNRTSFDNVLSKWYPEVRKFSQHIPIILVGTKLDLRSTKSENLVELADAQKLKEQIGAYALIECSALNKQNIDIVFQQAIRATLNKPEISAL